MGVSLPFRAGLNKYVPRWLANRLGRNVGFRYLWSAAVQLDVIVEAITQGIRCWLPGYPVAPPGMARVDASTALPLVARSRGLLQGEAETDEDFASRSLGWIDTWIDAASDEVLVQEIQNYLGNTPTVRIVSRAGNWTSIAPDGTITQAQAAWNWDSVSNPERAGWWSDLWIIIYPCEWPITGPHMSSLVGVWGTYAGFGGGHKVDRAAVGAILQLVAQWKGAHVFVPAILWSYDSTLFDPANIGASGNPDGTWGSWGYTKAGVYGPARTGASDGRVRYWTPSDGG